jgi:TonB family protein
MFLRRCITAILFFAAVQVAVGQSDLAPEPQLIKQPRPSAVKDASRTGIYGDVLIRVAVDAKGNVTSAEFDSGPGWACPVVTNAAVNAFRASARAAALKAKFRPALHSGSPVASTSTLRYLFAERKKSSNGKTTRLMIVGTANKAEGGPNASRGVLNSAAIVLAKPVYPRLARANGVSGSVSVQVIIDEDGTVLSAEPTGHPLLNPAAHTAACDSKFSPTLLSGKPVKVSGIITYNFNR